MKPVARLPLLVLVLVAVAGPVVAQDPARFDQLPTSPGVVGGALGGLSNPAAWGLAPDELAFLWADDTLDEWALSFGSPVGLSAEHAPGLWRYRAGLSLGNRRARYGTAWRWAAGGAGPEAESGLESGWILRPATFLSLGLSGFFSAQSDRSYGLADLGIRPLGSSHLTLFGDAFLRDGQRGDDAVWSVGAEVRPADGFQVSVRWRDLPGGDDEVRVGLAMQIGGTGYHSLVRTDDDASRPEIVHVVRANPPNRPLRSDHFLLRGNPYFMNHLVTFDLEGKWITDRRDRFLDSRRVAWLDLTRAMRRLHDDPEVRGVALNLSGTAFDTSKLWELRSELQALQASGRHVRVRLERPRMALFYAVSTADEIVLDPYGWVDLSGISLSRTYWAGMLDKLGIGFEELRFFHYKTANERYSRTELSEADREQMDRQAELLYREIVAGIADGAGLTTEEVERLGEDEALLRPEQAVELGLVDRLGSFDDLKVDARKDGFTTVGPTAPYAAPEDRWGEPPVIEVIYARGVSEMDSGLRGRATGRHVARLGGWGGPKAVVLRAESPGGDPMATGRIVDGLTKLRERGTPVVASQGTLAASAGYSVCLPSDRILTTPFTITGSIGVIAGWAWDDGLGERIGLTGDGVQRGSHADLRSGIRLPFVGLSVPRRPLRDDERELARRRILAGYDRFVQRVAAARELEESRVREIGEGRVWMGGDALELGLVDDFGTLGDALEEARRRAGIDPDDEVTYREYPPRRWWRMPSFGPRLPGASWLFGFEGENEELPVDEDYLRALLDRPGEVQELVPPGQLPPEWLGP